MSLVLDASMTLSWYFDDERTPATDAALDRVTRHGAVVPTIWPLEVANAFRTALRRNRIDVGFRDDALTRLGRLPITVDVETALRAWTGVLALSDRFARTVYDAAYLESARRRGLPLASLDTELCRAARTLGVATAFESAT